jgi:hypothetical protein
MERVTHAYNPSDWEDHGSTPALANSLRDPISKAPRPKWTGVMAKTIECLLCRHSKYKK